MPAIHRDKIVLVQIAAVVEIRRLLHAVGQAHIILAARPADGGKFRIAVHIDFYLAFTPPLSGRQVADADNGAYKAALVFSLRQHDKVTFGCRRILPAEQHVQPADIPRVLVFNCVVDLIEQRNVLFAFVGQRDFRTFVERHGQPDIHAGISAQRVYC